MDNAKPTLQIHGVPISLERVECVLCTVHLSAHPSQVAGTPCRKLPDLCSHFGIAVKILNRKQNCRSVLEALLCNSVIQSLFYYSNQNYLQSILILKPFAVKDSNNPINSLSRISAYNHLTAHCHGTSLVLPTTA